MNLFTKILVQVIPHLRKRPALYNFIKSVYYRRGRLNGYQLVTYAKGKSCIEKFHKLGIGKNLIQVNVLYSALNSGTERANFLKLPNTRAVFPNSPAASGVGMVTKVGGGVKGIKRGDIVAGPMHHSNVDLIKSSMAIKIKEGVKKEDAAYFHLAIIAIQGIRMGQVKAGSKVAVIGQGIIGRIATLLARAMAAEVTVVTRTKDKLNRFNENGIATSSSGSDEKIASLYADIVIDASGSPNAINTAINAVKNNGKIILLGSNRGLTNQVKLRPEKSVSIVGAHIRNINEMPPEWGKSYLEEAVFIQELLLKGKLSFGGLTSRSISCVEADEFYNHELPKGVDIGVLIDWQNHQTLAGKINPSINSQPNTAPSFVEKIKIALIGCGDIGFVNARAIDACSGFELYVAMDTELGQAEKLGKQFNVKYTSDIDDILSDEKVNTVLIAVPHFLHERLAIQVAQSGKNVIVEKPLAINVAEAENMIRAAMGNNVLLKTLYPAVYEPAHQFAKKLIDEDAIGRITGISMEYQRDRPLSYWYNRKDGKGGISWRGVKKLSGGGFMIMYLIHAIDYLNYMTGLEVEEVSAKYDTLLHPVDVEDTVGIVFKAKNNAIGTISTSSAVRGQGGSLLRIWGENGQVKIDGDTVEFFSLKTIGQYAPLVWHKIKLEKSINPRSVFFDNFRQSLENQELTSETERGYASLRIIEAAYQSGQQKHSVKIKEAVNLKMEEVVE